MARARNLKPSFFTDDQLAEVAPLGRLLFQGLWCMADREGRLEDRPKKIKAEILPYDNCNVERLLADLDKARFIVRYERDGQRFIQVRQFKKHQNPHIKEPASTIPAPDSHGAGTSCGQNNPEAARLILDSGFPLPDSGSRIPDSALPLPDSNRAVLPTPTEEPSAKEKNGAIEKKNGAKTKHLAHWSADAAGIAATAKTLGLTRHPQEDEAAFKDRVFATVNAKRISDAAKASRGIEA